MKLRGVFFLSIFSFALVCLPGWSQQKQQPQPEKPSQQGPTRSQQSQSLSVDEYQRVTPVYLTGSVVFEDGTPLSDPVPVELVCGGRVMRQVNLSVSGTFTLDVGNNNLAPTVMDASVSEPAGLGSSPDLQWSGLGDSAGVGWARIGSIDLSGCEVRLSPGAGYQARSILLSRHSTLENPNIGFIVVRRPDAEGGTAMSVTTLAAPEEAQKSYAKAREELRKEKPNLKKAKEELEKATEAYPKYAEAWHLLGKTGMEMQDEDLARSAFAESFAADPKFTPPYFDLIYLELKSGRFGEAAQMSNALLDLVPDAARAQYFHGLAYYNLGDSSIAEESFRKIEKSGKWREIPMAILFLGLIDANQGEIPLAAKELQTFLRVTPEKLFPEGLKDQLIERLQAWESEGLIEAETTPLPEIQD